jgi:oligopeptide transport system ATP-binding protein
MASVPRLDTDTREKLVPIEGQPPDLTAVPPGCAFHPRCNYATEQCGEDLPELRYVSDEHQTACWVNTNE